jgi:hypothetical protein
MVIYPSLQLGRFFTPKVITALDVSGMVAKHLNVCIIAVFQLFLQLLNCRGVLAKEAIASEEKVPLAVVFVALYGVEREQGEHLI